MPIIAPSKPVAASNWSRQWLCRLRAHRALIAWCVISLLLGAALVAGLAVRRATWEVTKPIRFGDIQNGFYWGWEASGPQGYLNQYEKMAREDSDWGRWLDYAPLRLAVMDIWVSWVRENYAEPSDDFQDKYWNPAYEFNRPVLDFNTGMDLLAAVCAFFLTRLWVRRARAKQLATRESELPQFTGVIPGLVAALTLWFNPAMLISAYGWPTWDAWIVPMYLLAALLACLDWWFCAGLAIAAGAMFKGQQLTVAPVFLLWALMLGRVGAAGRWAVGLIVGMAAIAAPWLFSYLSPHDLAIVQFTKPYSHDPNSPAVLAVRRIVEYPAIAWVCGLIVIATIAFLLLGWLARPRLMLAAATENTAASPPIPLHRIIQIFASAVLFALALIPWCASRNLHLLWLGLLLSAGLAAAVWLPRRARPFTVAAAGGSAALLCMLIFHGSHAWWDCGFHFGTIHWQWMIMGHTDNLPGLLEIRYKWPHSALEHAVTLDPLGGHWPIFSRLQVWPAAALELSSKQLFDSIYTVLLLISGIGLGLQARRTDPRFLVALITPWVLFFTIPVQIHERYLLFAAGAAAICIGQSVGAWLLGLVLSFFTLVMTLHVMMLNGADIGEFGYKLSFLFPWLFSPDSGKTIFKYIDGSYPDAAWAVVLCAGIFLYLSLAPSVRWDGAIGTVQKATDEKE